MVKVKKGKTKRSAPTNSAPESSKVTDVPAIIDKAHVLLAQSNFELAIKFLERALSLEPGNLEARELLGVAELEGGDVDNGRQHLLQLFPPHTSEAPTSPSPYLYLAQTAGDPQEALGYYTTAVAMVENALGKGKGRAEEGPEEEELRKMAVTALVAMIEIWMSDLCFEAAASDNCDALIARAMEIAPGDLEALMTLASIRMSQSKFDEAKDTVLRIYADLEGRDPSSGTIAPPHTSEAPTSPSPYLYLAQTAGDPQEALGYYTTAVAMVENALGKGKGRAEEGPEEEELRKMAVTALVAMIEIWMSDLCFEAAASDNCDALIARAMEIAPGDLEALMTLASIRMSQSKFDEAKDTVLRIYADLEGRDPCEFT
ncbi:hypothetical protein A1Q2_00909 [Trichosporon asahii var. asahii CBS 8904]|uniref:Uncharacterized protein n=1 Tax=Trichosporon asahii var. asahii (strain CBS 8904) TaxID=1220162 RepID=K1W7D6_TRIAC|nr:hypothetical protein A1Q2_00909 [Trichosporon asahii var. asahii CBS 8904]